MPEPRTHYQVSFTSRQAVLLFVVVLVSLAGAYFLGLATGLAGRQPPESASAATPAPTPATETAAVAGTPHAPSPAASTAAATPEPRPTATGAAAREPAAEGGLQFFEDHPEEPGKAAQAPARKPAPAAAPAGGFWVQILSTTSQNEAKSRRAALSAHGFLARVVSTRGARGPELYRVRVGPYASREEASRAADALVRKEKVKTWIVPPGE